MYSTAVMEDTHIFRRCALLLLLRDKGGDTLPYYIQEVVSHCCDSITTLDHVYRSYMMHFTALGGGHRGPSNSDRNTVLKNCKYRNTESKIWKYRVS